MCVRVLWLQVLNLAGNNIVSLPASALAPLTSLEVLDMSGCGLTTLPTTALATLGRLTTVSGVAPLSGGSG